MFKPRVVARVGRSLRGCYTTVKSNPVPKEFNLISKEIASKIRATGPVTIAQYMKEVLISPSAGYYMHRDVFGASGDFITSPELNQMFGEMVAIWFLNEWSKAGCPKPIQIIELGPGRGTLSQDLLRVFDHFRALQGTSLHLVELSPVLSELQARSLCLQSDNIMEKGSVFFKQGISHHGIPVKWYKHLQDVPNGFSFVIAHEFFDALPVHKFQKSPPEGYREVLVDIDPSKELAFRYVIAREPTPASKMLISSNESREHLEISPESHILVKDISKRLESHGGLALIADYGHCGESKDSFRAFKKHKLHDPLVEPGSADLTADVDFSALKQTAVESGGVLSFGPVTQRDFLLRMGIEQRFEALEKCAKEEHLEGLRYSYHMITDADKMGTRFKFLALIPEVLKTILDKYPPVGFH